MTKLEEKKTEAVRVLLRKFLLDDCLRPQYNGMTAWKLAHLLLQEVDKVEEAEMNDVYLKEQEMKYKYSYQPDPNDFNEEN